MPASRVSGVSIRLARPNESRHRIGTAGVHRSDSPADPDFGDEVLFRIPDDGRGKRFYIILRQAVDRRGDRLAFRGQQAARLLVELHLERDDDPTDSGGQDRQHGEAAGQFSEVRQGNRVDRSEVVSDRAPVDEGYDRPARFQLLHNRADRARVGCATTYEQREQALSARQRAEPLPAPKKLGTRPLQTQGAPAIPRGGPSGWSSQSGGCSTVYTMEASFQPRSVRMS